MKKNTRRVIWTCVCNALETTEFDQIALHNRKNGKTVVMSCIQYWKLMRKEKGLSPMANYCRHCRRRMSDPENPIVGGHVIGFLHMSPRVYITPMLKGCNSAGSNLPYFKVRLSDLIPVPKNDNDAILAKKENKEEIDRQKKIYQQEHP